MEKYPNIYKLLKRIGHSPAKALEIIIGARRGEEHACTWVKIAFATRWR